MGANEIRITLGSASMGDVDEVDFDCWAAYVVDAMAAATWLKGYDVRVVQRRFGEPGDDEVNVRGDMRSTPTSLAPDIAAWLRAEGWDAFCGEEWDSRRKARDAAT